jgi:adenylate kinase
MPIVECSNTHMEVSMRLILLGAPGAGKGTQAVALAEKLNIPHISTGEIFRSNIKKGTKLGKKAKEYIDKGALVPDEVTIGIVSERLAQQDCKPGFILDGFPRTIPQAESLDKVLENMGIDIDYVIDIHVPDSNIIKRLSGRRVCKDCGATYHIHSHPTSNEGICDACSAPVIIRKDDREETVLNRLETYHMQTEPLIEYYRQKGKLLAVEGTKPAEDTTNELLGILGVIK